MNRPFCIGDDIQQLENRGYIYSTKNIQPDIQGATKPIPKHCYLDQNGILQIYQTQARA